MLNCNINWILKFSAVRLDKCLPLWNVRQLEQFKLQSTFWYRTAPANGVPSGNVKGESFLSIEASRSLSDTLYSVGFLWTSDLPNEVTSTSQHSKQTHIQATGGVRTLNPSKWAAADLRLRPRGHRVWQLCPFTFCYYKYFSGDLLFNSHVTNRNEFLHADSGLFHHSST
jgi:hypothetical protein